MYDINLLVFAPVHDTTTQQGDGYRGQLLDSSLPCHLQSQGLQ